MTTFAPRLATVRASGESGSVLAIALVFLMIFGVTIGVTLQFATTSQRTGAQVALEGGATYAGSGALDGAVNRLRSSLTTGTEVDGTSICFNLPGGELDNAAAVSVTCTPLAGSGSTAGGPSVPAEAILATSGRIDEGVSLSGTATHLVRGPVRVNQRLLVPGGSTLSSRTTTIPAAAGSINAGICSVTGTADPACATPGGAADPAWAGPTAYPKVVQQLGSLTCQSPVMRLWPGTYLDGSDLQDVLDCNNTVVWFQKGTYYFDFRDGNDEIRVRTNGVVVGGTESGWVPGTTPATGVPYPTAAAPGVSACNPDLEGVNFVFGGASRLRVSAGGKVQLCARETSSTAQNIVVQSLRTTSTLPADAPATQEASGSTDFGAGANWSNDGEAADVDGNVATVTVNSNSTSQTLRIGPFPADLVPPDATGISVTVAVANRLNGYGTSRVRLNDNGSTVLPTMDLRTCPAGGCSDTAIQLDSVPVPVALSAAAAVALVNNLYVDVLVSSSSSGSTTARVDGVTVRVDFSAPIRPTSGTGTGAPYTTSLTGTRTAVLRSSGTAPSTVLALHGTVHVPLAVVDLGITAVPYTVIDRGVVARHVRLAMTPANATVYLIALPVAVAAPRQVLLVAASGSVELARAEATLHDGTGATNGSVVGISAWFVP